MRIAIIDDLEQERTILTSYLKKYCQANSISVRLSTYSSGEEFLKTYTDSFDLIFLDVYMGGMTGLETAQKIRESNQTCLLVFSTASPDFALKSFRVRAFDYLVKPYSYEQFIEVMNLAEKQLKNVLHYIEVKESRELVRVLLQNIVYVDYSNHYIQIHATNRIIKTYMNFADFSALLKDYPNFLNCYRNCLVNLDYVTSLKEHDFLLSTGESIPISREKRIEIRKLYAEYVFQKLNGDI